MHYNVGDVIECRHCGGRSRVTAIEGNKLELELLSTGAVPGQCGNCGNIICAACMSKGNGKCPICGVSGDWTLYQQWQLLGFEAPKTVGRSESHSDIFASVETGDLDAVRAQLATNPTLIATRRADGCTVLHIAVLSKSQEIIEYLLNKKSDVSITDNKGQSALMYAVANDSPEIVRILLEHGANPNVQSNNGLTPLFDAATHGRTQIAALLIKHGADIEQTGSGLTGDIQLSLTPLQIAVLQGHLELVELLASAGAKVRARESVAGMEPIHFAVVAVVRGTGSIETLKRLVELGADVNAKDKEGHTPLKLARKYSKDDVAKELKDLGATESTSCFIATAVYGGQDAEQVVTLRRYRDNVLAKSHMGRRLSGIYNVVGPLLAVWVDRGWIPRLLLRWAFDLLANRLESTKRQTFFTQETEIKFIGIGRTDRQLKHKEDNHGRIQ
jgi:ankyrin repeat protein